MVGFARSRIKATLELPKRLSALGIKPQPKKDVEQFFPSNQWIENMTNFQNWVTKLINQPFWLATPVDRVVAFIPIKMPKHDYSEPVIFSPTSKLGRWLPRRPRCCPWAPAMPGHPSATCPPSTGGPASCWSTASRNLSSPTTGLGRCLTNKQKDFWEIS